MPWSGYPGFDDAFGVEIADAYLLPYCACGKRFARHLYLDGGVPGTDHHLVTLANHLSHFHMRWRQDLVGQNRARELVTFCLRRCCEIALGEQSYVTLDQVVVTGGQFFPFAHRACGDYYIAEETNLSRHEDRPRGAPFAANLHRDTANRLCGTFQAHCQIPVAGSET
ncbi:hypothetical protein A9G05_07260 [Pseudomonas sp. ENNP23]|nr:hypothetical protein A9G05_07260 [Pseudomonas sp. ENNP23]